MYVYIIEDEGGKVYTGITNNIERRLKEHNAGQHRTTKHGKNWSIVFCQKCKDRKEARQFEKHLKKGYSREIRNNLMRQRGVEQPGSSQGS